MIQSVRFLFKTLFPLLMANGNNYRTFVEGAQDEDTLYELIEALKAEGWAGTPLEGQQYSGDVNFQYRVVVTGNSQFVEDKLSGDRVWVSGNGFIPFIDVAERYLEDELCNGFDYGTYKSIENQIAKDD